MNRNLFKTLKNQYHRIPARQRIWIGKILFPARLLIRGFSSICFEVYRVDGWDGMFWYIASSEPDLSFIELFSPDPVITRTGSLYAWGVRGFCRTCDRVMIDTHRYLVPFLGNGLVTAAWIRQVLDTRIPVETILPHIREKKKISRFRMEISADTGDFNRFIDTVYNPYLLRRYPNALLREFDIDLFRETWLRNSGEFLSLKVGDVTVGGACCDLSDNTYHLRMIALADEHFLRDGAMAAIYYYVILRAQEKNVELLDLGLSRPFLSDGVLSFKRKWRARIIPDENPHVIFLKNLRKEGLIVREDGQLRVLVSPEHISLRTYTDSGLGLSPIE